MLTDALVFDIETSVIPGAAAFCGEVQAPAHYKNEEAIASYVTKKSEKELSQAATDPDLCRIVTICWKEPGDDRVLGYLARDDEEERRMLEKFWLRIRSKTRGIKTLVGYNIHGFDLPVLLRRSLYLNVQPPDIHIKRYKVDHTVDLMQVLSFDGRLTYRKKEFYLRRLGIDIPNPCSGADVPGLIAMGDYDTVLAHCKADVEGEYQMALRLGVIEPGVPAAVSLEDVPF